MPVPYSFISVQASLTGPGAAGLSLGYGASNAEEGIATSQAEDKVSTTTGSDGNIMHSLHAGITGTVTIRLLKTSPVNAQLDLLYNLQSLNPALAGQNVITVSDVARGDLVTATDMAFTKPPDLAWAKEGNIVEWVFRGRILRSLGAGSPT